MDLENIIKNLELDYIHCSDESRQIAINSLKAWQSVKTVLCKINDLYIPDYQRYSTQIIQDCLNVINNHLKGLEYEER